MAKKIIYDNEEDILFMSKGRKVKSSVDIGDFIIDINSEGNICGLEILNATDNLNLTSSQLKEIQEASMNINYRPNFVSIILTLKLSKKEKEITIPLSLNHCHRSAKTEKLEFAAV